MKLWVASAAALAAALYRVRRSPGLMTLLSRRWGGMHMTAAGGIWPTIPPDRSEGPTPVQDRFLKDKVKLLPPGISTSSFTAPCSRLPATWLWARRAS